MIPENIDEIALRYKTIKLPTLIVWCQQDKVVPVVLGLRLHEEMRSSELALFSIAATCPKKKSRKTHLRRSKHSSSVTQARLRIGRAVNCSVRALPPPRFHIKT